MISRKTFNLDLIQLKKVLKEKKIANETDNTESVRTTVFTYNQAPQLQDKQEKGQVKFLSIELLKDGLNRPMALHRWSYPRNETQMKNLLGFNIYRRKLSDFEINNNELHRFRPKKLTELGLEKLLSSNQFGSSRKFSNDKRAFHLYNPSLLPESYINNTNSDVSKKRSKLSSFIKSHDNLHLKAEFALSKKSEEIKKVAYVDYNQYKKIERRKPVQVVDSDAVFVEFLDKTLRYGDAYEYYIVPVTKEKKTIAKSNSIKIIVTNLNIPVRPKNLSIKQEGETKIVVAGSVDKRSLVENFHVYKKKKSEPFYKKLVVLQNKNDNFSFVDRNITYLEDYSYRVFCENIFGRFSEPREVSFFSSVQRITPETRSNNLKKPIFSAIQDQNSSFARINIYPNDPKISYYKLERRDLTIFEQKFTKPSKEFTNYGGDGWSTDIFYVNKRQVPLSKNSYDYRQEPNEEILPGRDSNTKLKTILEPITFSDDTVTPGRIYEYRLVGYDLFGNKTSHSFSKVRISAKKSLRSPINIKSTLLRHYPFRVKISWTDDNADSSRNKYIIERRRKGEQNYKRFPLTENNFFIDEVATTDFINFSKESIEDNFTEQENKPDILLSEILKEEPQRPFEIPDFLQKNDTYYYRISTISDIQEKSNFSEEFALPTFPQLSDPKNLQAIVLSKRVKPLSVFLTWDVDEFAQKPDRWIIQRKVDVDYEKFMTLGHSYIKPQFLDNEVSLGNNYIYRVISLDSEGKESNIAETRVTI